MEVILRRLETQPQENSSAHSSVYHIYTLKIAERLIDFCNAINVELLSKRLSAYNTSKAEEPEMTKKSSIVMNLYSISK